jgi:N-acetylneuraminic acid mutarotase
MKTNNRFKTTKITLVLVELMTTVMLTSVVSARAGTWTQKADMPTARTWLSTSVVDGKIYAVGGKGGSKKLEEYDPATDTWMVKADMPTGRVMLSTSVVDGKIYAIGGYDRWPNGIALANVEEYDPVTDTWTKKADLPAPRATQATCVVNGRIYAIGGGKSGILLSPVVEYDPSTDTWTKKADIPTARAFVATSVVDRKIYAFGGITPTTWPAFPTVEQYDPVTDTWTKKADMPAPRAFHISVVDEKIYAFGGNTSRGGTPLSTLFQYNPATDTWTKLDDMPVRMLGMGTSTVGGRIYIAGGTSTPYPYNPPLSTVWEFDTGLRVASPDINGDGVVDGADFSIMVDHWNMDEPLCDIAPEPWGDDIVDIQDLVLLSEYLLTEFDDSTLVAHWALDEAEGAVALDSVSDNGYSNGYVIGDPLWLPDGGMVDGAIQLDGVDDYIITSPVLNPANGSFSVLAWIKGGAPGQTVISAPGNGNWLSADPSDGSLMTELKASGRSGVPLLSQTIFTDGDWHRIGFVWDGSYRTLYVDSIVVAQDIQDSMSSSSNGLYFGTGSDMSPGTYFSGLIDDIRIYNRVVIP